MKTEERYLSYQENNFDESIKSALRYARQRSRSEKTYTKISFIFNSNESIKILNKVYDTKLVKALQDGNEENNIIYKAESINSFIKSYNISVIAIAICLTQGNLFCLDESCKAEIIIAVPYNLEDLNIWLLAWDPIDINTGKKIVNRIDITDLNKNYLNRLLVTHHSLDNERDKNVIHNLRLSKDKLNKEEVLAYLIGKKEPRLLYEDAKTIVDKIFKD
jgi:hypothetical protein